MLNVSLGLHSVNPTSGESAESVVDAVVSAWGRWHIRGAPSGRRATSPACLRNHALANTMSACPCPTS